MHRRMRRRHLAETPPAVWVAHVRGDAITVTVARKTLGEAIVSRSAAVTPAAADSGLATTQKSDTIIQDPRPPAHTVVLSHTCTVP